jgi:hypothetical protein
VNVLLVHEKVRLLLVHRLILLLLYCVWIVKPRSLISCMKVLDTLVNPKNITNPSYKLIFVLKCFFIQLLVSFLFDGNQCVSLL